MPSGDLIGEVTETEKLVEAMAPADAQGARNSKARKIASGTPLHLMDIHLEKGMQCVDCHFLDQRARQWETLR